MHFGGCTCFADVLDCVVYKLVRKNFHHYLFVANLYNYFTAEARSRGSSRSSSGHSTPRKNVASLPPGFIGNSYEGNDITVEGTAIIEYQYL